MSIRIAGLFLLAAGLGLYAWKDWFRSLCGLIVLMAFLEHRDMPKNLFGIQGLNAWNLLLCVICAAWLTSRRREGLQGDMPSTAGLLLLMYLGVVAVGVVRAALDHGHLAGYPLSSLISEELINTTKWILPGLLLFDGARTRTRVVMVIACLLTMYFLISIQVIRRVPHEAAFITNQAVELARVRLSRRIGYNACDLSAMFAGAFWGILAVLPLVRRRSHGAVLLAVAAVIAFGQALTGGRAGFLAWGTTGLVLCLLRWRKYLILVPAVVVLLLVMLPGVAGRMRIGFGQVDAAGQSTVDPYLVTSGRSVIWGHVLDKIGDAPVLGHGRLAMRRLGLTESLGLDYREAAGHPHNMYLETLLDNGVLGSLLIFWLWGVVMVCSVRLFRSSNRLYSAVGGLTLSLVLAQLLAGIGAQHVYPRESTLGTWAAMFLTGRVYVEERRAARAERAGLLPDAVGPDRTGEGEEEYRGRGGSPRRGNGIR